MLDNYRAGMKQFTLSFFLILLISLLFVVPLYAEPLATFEQYPAPLYQGIHAKDIQLKNDDFANTFRTRLRAALKSPVNFAGHYVITTWGCGTSGCFMGAIVDVKTGQVYSHELLGPIIGKFVDDEWLGGNLSFKPDSSLLIASGVFESLAGKEATFYINFQQGQLQILQQTNEL